MQKIVFINVCIRKDNSRTLKLAKPLLEVLSKRYEIEEIDLTNSDLLPINYEQYFIRGNQGLTSDDIKYAKMVASADRIVIAAPFWDMSFPSVLKVFFEHISAPNLTFSNNDDGSTRGICKANKILYITTRGMNIKTASPLDQGTSYLKALGWLWGIDDVVTVSVSGADLVTSDIFQNKLTEAIEYGKKICEVF